MRKILPTILVLILALSITGCGKTVKSITYNPPEGFTETENGIWTSPDENDLSNILLTSDKKDSNFKNYTEETLEDTYEDSLAAEGFEIDVKMDSFEFIKIDECDAIRVQCSYICNDINVTQIQYIVDADKTYIYTFTNMGDADWLDAFDKSAESISIEYN